MMKVVLKLDLHDDKSHKKVMKAVSTLSGYDLLTIDTKEKTLTVVGKINPLAVIGTMMKSGGQTKLLKVEPAEEEKKAEPKKEEAKKKEPKKEEAKKKEKKKEEEKKEEPKKEDILEISNTDDNVSNDHQIAVYSPNYYNPNMNQHYYRVVEEQNPPGCVIS